MPNCLKREGVPTEGILRSFPADKNDRNFLSRKLRRKTVEELYACRLLVSFSDAKVAGSTLAVLDGGKLHPLSTPYSSFGSLSVYQTGGKLALATVGGSPTKASEAAVLVVDSVDALISTDASQWQTLRKSSSVEVRSEPSNHVLTVRMARSSAGEFSGTWDGLCLDV